MQVSELNSLKQSKINAANSQLQGNYDNQRQSQITTKPFTQFYSDKNKKDQFTYQNQPKSYVILQDKSDDDDDDDGPPGLEEDEEFKQGEKQIDIQRKDNIMDLADKRNFNDQNVIQLSSKQIQDQGENYIKGQQTEKKNSTKSTGKEVRPLVLSGENLKMNSNEIRKKSPTILTSSSIKSQNSQQAEEERKQDAKKALESPSKKTHEESGHKYQRSTKKNDGIALIQQQEKNMEYDKNSVDYLSVNKHSINISNYAQQQHSSSSRITNQEDNLYQRKGRNTKIMKVSPIEATGKQDLFNKRKEVEISEYADEYDEEQEEQQSQQNYFYDNNKKKVTKEREKRTKKFKQSDILENNNSVASNNSSPLEKQSISEIYLYIDKINESIKASNEKIESMPKLLKAQKSIQVKIEEYSQELAYVEKERIEEEQKLLKEHQKKKQLSLISQEGTEENYLKQLDLIDSLQKRESVLELQSQEFRERMSSILQELITAKKDHLRSLKENEKLIEDFNKQSKVCSKMGKTLVEFHQIISVELGRLKQSNFLQVDQNSQEPIQKEDKKPLQIKKQNDLTEVRSTEYYKIDDTMKLKQELAESLQREQNLKKEVEESRECMERLMSDAEEAKEIIKNQLRLISSEKEKMNQERQQLDRDQSDLQQQLLIHSMAQEISTSQLSSSLNNNPSQFVLNQTRQQMQSQTETFNQYQYSQLTPTKQPSINKSKQSDFNQRKDINNSYSIQSALKGDYNQEKQNSLINLNTSSLTPNNNTSFFIEGQSSLQSQRKQAQEGYYSLKQRKKQIESVYSGKSSFIMSSSPKIENSFQLDNSSQITSQQDVDDISNKERPDALSAIKDLIAQIQSEHNAVVRDLSSLKEQKDNNY